MTMVQVMAAHLLARPKFCPCATCAKGPAACDIAKECCDAGCRALYSDFQGCPFLYQHACLFKKSDRVPRVKALMQRGLLALRGALAPRRPRLRWSRKQVRPAPAAPPLQKCAPAPPAPAGPMYAIGGDGTRWPVVPDPPFPAQVPPPAPAGGGALAGIAQGVMAGLRERVAGFSPDDIAPPRP